MTCFISGSTRSAKLFYTTRIEVVNHTNSKRQVGKLLDSHLHEFSEREGGADSGSRLTAVTTAKAAMQW
eukprot:3048000-Pleurochrysis_carterae.AAC.4